MIRISVASPAGQALSIHWRVRATPAFLLFDSAGREIWRGFQVPTTEALRGRLRGE